ncbi:hypothetical protein CVIRNUC_005842 [Coccomyxa viridis]|uniref:DUF7897 domain-containing protein n=1 Tax=Coccomyxa viridis TaxID=1274662 RepID=A0AAV1I7C4_9CHLO|nr:hypothetical protein CVIRNUC_005842 [Coccomyxa viridis]
MQRTVQSIVLAQDGLLEASKGSLAAKERIDLLKAIEGLSRKEYTENAAFKDQHSLLGSDSEARARCLRAVLDQQWQGIPEYSQEFYKVLEAASTKQQLTRALVRHALQTLPHGFDALDTNLIFHASLVSDAYDKWYRAFAQAVQGNKTAQQLEKDDKEGKVPKEFFNNYSIVSYSDGKYSQVAYADYFKDKIAEIVGLFDPWIADLKKLRTDKEDIRDLYVDYLSQYRSCLAETGIAKLDSMW